MLSKTGGSFHERREWGIPDWAIRRQKANGFQGDCLPSGIRTVMTSPW